MDYFQGVVTEYLVADRSSFVNTELLIQLDAHEPKKGRHWYCDAASANFKESTLYLCEVTYSKTMSALAKRLLAWNENWPHLEEALRRDCCIPESWKVKPWVFIPESYYSALKTRIISLEGSDRSAHAMPYPKITFLEQVVPWKYITWDRKVTDLEDES